HLERAEGMLSSLAAHAHRLRVRFETLLHGFEQVLMLPARDTALCSRCALRLERAARACRRPVAAQRLTVLLVRIPIDQPLARRTAITVFGRVIDEVLLAEATIRLGARCHRLRQRHRDASLLAGQY